MWQAIRERGNRLPIHIGLPGPCGLTSLTKFAIMSGIGPSIRVLTRQARILSVTPTLTPNFPELSAGMAGSQYI